jgi:hypothetical protein
MATKYKRKWIVKERPYGYKGGGKWDRIEPDMSNGYIISLTEDDKWQCSCPQWKFRRITCKHITMVLHKFKFLNMRYWDHPNLEDYSFEEIDPEITGTIAEIAAIIGKTDKKEKTIEEDTS